MIKELAILLLGAAVLWGCDNTNARVEEYCGVYEGTLPAADAPGIKTTISLDRNHHFTMKSVYIDKKDGTFNEQGTYSRDSNVLELRAADDDVSYYKIEPGQLRRLNMDKKPVEGALAEHYVLKKVSGCK